MALASVKACLQSLMLCFFHKIRGANYSVPFDCLSFACSCVILVWGRKESMISVHCIGDISTRDSVGYYPGKEINDTDNGNLEIITNCSMKIYCSPVYN
jgi:hypothetical protein